MWDRALLAALLMQAAPRISAQERRCVGRCRIPGVMPRKMRAAMHEKEAQWSRLDAEPVEPSAGITGPHRCETSGTQGEMMAGEYRCSGVDMLSLVPRTYQY